jgi:hypothetical protein
LSVPSRRAWSLVGVALAGLLRAASTTAASTTAAPTTAAPTAPAPTAPAPIDAVRDCAAHAPDAAIGIEDLNLACPGLEDALQALGLDRLLYDGWRQRLNRDSLRDAAKLAEGYRGAVPGGAPDVAALGAILRTLSAEQAPAPKTWWEVFKAWLHDWLRSRDAGALSWLDRWLEDIRRSVTLLNAMIYLLSGLVLIAAGWIVVNELKAAGLFARTRRRPPLAARESTAADSAGAAAAEPTALALRLSLLLRLLVARLMQTGRLSAERSLTHRELVMRARFDSDSQRSVFGTVASTAESMLYGARSAAPEQLISVLRQGQALLAELPDSTGAR